MIGAARVPRVSVAAGRLARTPLAVVLALVGLLYVPVARDLVAAWWTSSYHTYGFLIVPFSVWVAWDARRELCGVAFAAWRPGLLVTTAGLAVLAAGVLVDSLTLRGLSLPLVLAGLGLFALGRSGFAPLAFPVAFLAFMAPLPASALARLSPPLQHLAAAAAAGGLGALGIPATRDGLFVRLPSVSLHVEEWCNGLRFLLAMLVIGVAFAWLGPRSGARRLALVAIAAAVGLGANLARVTGTGVIAHVLGPAAASGLLHLAWGKLVYLVAMLAFVAAALALRGPGSASAGGTQHAGRRVDLTWRRACERSPR